MLTERFSSIICEIICFFQLEHGMIWNNLIIVTNIVASYNQVRNDLRNSGISAWIPWHCQTYIRGIFVTFLLASSSSIVDCHLNLVDHHLNFFDYQLDNCSFVILITFAKKNWDHCGGTNQTLLSLLDCGCQGSSHWMGEWVCVSCARERRQTGRTKLPLPLR